ncbi:SixA phosphatase family protein [Sphingomonas sp. TDK1]|uniref:SixA phosphatase family protein n=1 Tax=Sphingomonas sp. TDK1 TaxID=453247 RepID=UPI0007D9C596|nr:histidine phosphatase family protein [Sphingomonas sp. TDK1]OAN66375.1 histidine phosphatase family protein [Sphingomonas sp. TDK1]
MKTLLVLRHAKSGWDDPVARDFDRPLNPKGQRAAVAMGRYLRDQGLRFEHAIASPAVRVQETLAQVGHGYGIAIQPIWDQKLYLASLGTLLDAIEELPESAGTVLLSGHNPGLEELVLDRVRTPGMLRDAVEQKFPTATLAELRFDVEHWAEASRADAELIRFVRPRDLDPSLGPDA